MAKRKSKGPTATTTSTGIYKTDTLEASLKNRQGMADMMAVFAQAATSMNRPIVLEDRLRAIEEYARYYQDLDEQDEDEPKTALRRAAADCTDAILEEIRGDIGRTLGYVAALRRSIAREETDAAAYYALELGEVYERLQVRLGFERHVAAGKRALVRTSTARAGRVAEAATRKAEIIAAVRQRLVEHPRDSLSYASQQVANGHEEQPGWTLGTILRATRGLKKIRNGS